MTQHSFIAGIPLVLGGNVFGNTAKGEQAFAVLDTFYEAGGRMIDTADVYSAWVPSHVGGESETTIGQWLTSRGVRNEMKIHTKVGMLTGQLPVQIGGAGDPAMYTPERLMPALDASLDRLQTDYIDLYYAHRDYPDSPMDGIVATFDGAVKSGKVRSVGASNFSAERLSEALDIAVRTGAAPFEALQNEYNLVAREAYEGAVQQLCVERGIAALPFFGLAAGFLTGKYRTEEDLAKSGRGRTTQRWLESGKGVLAAMDAISAETGASLPAIALAWLRAQPGIAAPLASARTVEQVAPLVEGATLELTDEQVARLSAEPGGASAH